MRLGKLRVYFETSPALRLLRSPNAPFVIDWIDRQFKQAGRIAVPHSDLLASLAEYQEELRETDPDQLTAKPESYLSDWSGPDKLWLRRFLEAGRDEPVYQLTPATEDVFVFLDRVLEHDPGFVGTESRLKLVIDTLDDLVVGASEDPEARLRHLRETQRRVQFEIDQIEREGAAPRYRPAQIRERFITAVSLLRQLQGDFRAVEESFREITRQVQQRQVEGSDTRGGILGFALDSEDLLKKEDQGVSFYEFVRLILTPSQTERLESIIREVRRIPELESQRDGMDTVRSMVTVLQNEAEKVMRTNQRLSATLRRLLDARAHAERQRIASVLRQIRGHAVALATNPPIDTVGLSVDVEVDIESPFRRSFWQEPARLESIDLTDFTADEPDRMEAFRELAAMKRLEWKTMRNRIRDLLESDEAPTLAELLERHPPESGVIEVLGYLQIARDDGHLVNSAARQNIVIPWGDAGIHGDRAEDARIQIALPLVTFVRSGKNNHGR
jgi:hypothetical protein